MDARDINVLLCGDFGDPELQPALAFLAEMTVRFDVRQVDRLSAATRVDDDGCWSPDLIVIAQRRTGEYSHAAIRAMQRSFPLARCVCCLGAWCESEGRNDDDTWPAGVRVPARNAAARIGRELAVLNGRRQPLPLTASRDEVFAFDSPGDWSACPRTGIVSVKSPDRRLRETFEGLLRSAGCSIGRVDEARAVVWDVDPWEPPVVDDVRKFSNSNPDIAIVGIANFTHEQCAEELRECGVHSLVPKLAPAELLFAAIDAATLHPGFRRL